MSAPEPPLRLSFADDEQSLVRIEWRDGHGGTYPVRYLRGWCPCAACQGHARDVRFVDQPGARLVDMTLVGAYALQLRWDDGHATGLYTWERLRELCPCAGCGGAIEGTSDDVAALAPR